jgi:hypothetical protein
MLSTIFDTTVTELTAIVEKSESAEGATETIEKEGIVSFLEIRGTEEELKEIRRKLGEMVASMTAVAERDPASQQNDVERYRLTLAFFPLDDSTSDGR